MGHECNRDISRDLNPDFQVAALRRHCSHCGRPSYGWRVLAFGWYTHDRHIAQVKITIETGAKQCSENEKFPLFIVTFNSSQKTIEKVSFTLEARVKGRSTDIVDYHSYSDDHIIEPDTGWGQCWAVPKLKESVKDPRALDWSISYKRIDFKE
jgi:hypothetical protein